MRIGLLEDDHSQIELFGMWTRENGDQLQSFTDGKTFRNAVQQQDFDLLVLDWHLPDTTGINELDWLRSQRSTETPVIFITSRDSEASVVEALEHGADDYMVKPVKKHIAMARIRALQRRLSLQSNINQSHTPENTTESVEPYLFNRSEDTVEVNGNSIKLTHKEFELALYLFQHAGELVSRNRLMQDIWQTSAELNTRTIDTHISRIRTKLAINPSNGWQLSSIYQRGYRLTPVNNG